ncbi:hypothetical protein SEA_ALOEVERA_27 [Microbacterium phage AloeVera]|uniref:Uncharacterized protein n=2 Tax=Akonivirus akoni TaxID=2845587 RepID=A0A6M3SZ27_9CAUD|nr:hypothetical protein HWC17_gp26 [Microbacterium phage Akoni]QCG78312.1 hypothetical protein SEA_AKONI_26 [Microbacterium phage Akoni]QJD51276.1 hypothetical protein SEA_TRUONG_26 [Microbacterium phage Truong]
MDKLERNDWVLISSPTGRTPKPKVGVVWSANYDGHPVVYVNVMKRDGQISGHLTGYHPSFILESAKTATLLMHKMLRYIEL